MRKSTAPGSSPQVRGRWAGWHAEIDSTGLIPAGAGQIPHTGPTSSQQTAHPRRCGQMWCPFRCFLSVSGSSPQVRGRLVRGLLVFGANGLIPAGAGQIALSRTSGNASSAHPRRCGADQISTFSSAPLLGSSPQVRGRWTARYLHTGRSRLIPAGAGQIAPLMPAELLEEAHPRRCGADFGHGL